MPLLLAVLMLSGCYSPAPRRDPFAGMDMSTPRELKSLSVALVLSENAKSNLEYAAKSSKLCLGKVDPYRGFDDGVERLRRYFGTVARSESLEQAQSSGADLIAVWDSYMDVPQRPLSTVRLDARVIFLAPDKSEVAVIKAEGTASIGAGGFLGPKAYCGAVEEAIDAFLLNIEAASRNAAALVAYARGKGAPEAAPAAIRSDVDAPAYRFPEDPAKFALVVGAEKYNDLPEARFAERDAAAVQEHLLALGYPQRNIVTLSGPRASRASLAKHLESWLPERVGRDSTVLFYYSGHGAPDLRNGRAYLVPVDGDARFLESTGYPLQELYDRLAALKAKSVIVALDSCFSGAGGRSVLPQGTRPLVVKVDAGRPLGENLAVLSASAADEISGSLEAQGHGLFTYYLLKGLNERKGEATVGELYEYALPKVRDAARKDGRDQTPQLVGPGGRQARLR